MNARIKTAVGYLSSKISIKNRYFLSIVGAGVTLVVLIMGTAPQHDPNQAPEKLWPVSTISAQPATLSPELQLFGRLETPLHAQLTAALTAEVKSVMVREGDLVSEGQLLVALDDADALLGVEHREADLQDAQANLATIKAQHRSNLQILTRREELLELVQARVTRLSTLNSKHLIATETLEQARQEVARQAIALSEQQLQVENFPHMLARAESRVRQNDALLQQEQLNLSRVRISAPFDGRISSIDATPGDRVQAGSVMIAMYATEGLQIRAAIPSDTAAQLRRALDAQIDIEAFLEGNIPLSLEQLASEVSSGRSGIDAIFTLDQVHSDLALGRAVELTVMLPVVEDAVAVPVQSVHGNDRVYVVENARLKGITVQSVGQRFNANGEYELFVSSPELAAGTQIVTTNLAKATTGLKVEVVNPIESDQGEMGSEQLLASAS